MSWYEFIFGKPEPNPTVIEHPRLGTLTFDGENFWLGNVIADDFPLEIVLDWEGNAFPAGQDEICLWVIDNFAEIHKRAQVKLTDYLVQYCIPIELRFTPNEILWMWKEEAKKRFTIGFTDNQDENKLWRVEFLDLEPINCGYDD
jgi:hypothetical protein